MKKLLATKLLALSLILASSYGYAIDATKLARDLGWEPRESFETGIARTIQWYLDNEAWWQPLLTRSGVGQRLGKA